MPNMDGISLIKNVRSNSQHRAVPILILTTESDGAKKADGKAAGCDRLAGQAVQPGKAGRPSSPRVPMSMEPANPLAQFRQTYFEECAELLDALQSQLELLSNGGGDVETLHAIFRCVHSIKGGAGAFGFAALVAFSHVFESLLDAVRDKKIAATTDVVQLLLRASDALADIVSAARDDRSLPDGFAADIAGALEELLLGVVRCRDGRDPGVNRRADATQATRRKPVSDRASRHIRKCCKRPTSRCC